MTFWRFVINSIWHHRRTHLGVALGVGLTCAILIGALVVGDSVNYSLRQIASERLGNTQLALQLRDRYYTVELADKLAASFATTTAPLIQLEGIASTPQGDQRANAIQIVGVDHRFWDLNQNSSPLADSDIANPVVLNRALAKQLNASEGDALILRVEKPSYLPRDAVIASTDSIQIAMRVRVVAIIDAADFGNFNLEANQLAPMNAFVPLAHLQEELGRPGQANIMLVSQTAEAISPERAIEVTQQHWTLTDAALSVRELSDQNLVEIRTERVFFDPAAGDLISSLRPNPHLLLTYLVNGVSKGDVASPYTMVTAINPDAPNSPTQGLSDTQIVLNSWTAEDLQAQIGDTITLDYFAVDAASKLLEQSSDFTLQKVIPIDSANIDREMMPQFPGVAGAQNCRDWDTGIPIDLDRIRDKDEDYWDEYKGTPKALVTLNAGQKMWQSRFGDLTAVRYANQDGLAESLTREILTQLSPASVGYYFAPVAMMAQDAANQSMSFGGLFIGFSYFIIIAALLLTGLMFRFSIESRANELGTLRAFGFRDRDIHRMFLAETALLCVPGVVFGLVLGVFYARGILEGLLTFWSGAIGSWHIQFHATPAAILGGALGGAIMSLLTVYVSLRGFRNLPIRLLLNGEVQKDTQSGMRWWPWLLAILVGFIGGFALLASVGFTPSPNEAPLFFGSGSLFLVGLLASFGLTVAFAANRQQSANLTLGKLGVRNLGRRSGRSLALAGMLACGAFLVIGLESQRQDASFDADDPKAGTGGYSLIASTTQPVYKALETPQAQEQYAMQSELLAETQFVSMRLLAGDDASCLNLNRAQQPSLHGLDPQHFAERQAFSFAMRKAGPENPWDLLTPSADQSVIPAVGDFNTLTYSLGLAVGDRLDYVNEAGQTFQIEIVGALVNSIFQGSLLIHEQAFQMHYPSQAGYRQFLILTPPQQRQAVRQELEDTLADTGINIATTAEFLNAYNRVQNTYISIFQMLGALGLLLGSLGMAVVVLRNVLERRSELALLRAIGFSIGHIRKLLVWEHAVLFAGGLLIGVAAATIAILPRFSAPGEAFNLQGILILTGVLLFSGMLWTWLASLVALRGNVLSALRKE